MKKRCKKTGCIASSNSMVISNQNNKTDNPFAKIKETHFYRKCAEVHSFQEIQNIQNQLGIT
jgi:hypothetical protein